MAGNLSQAPERYLWVRPNSKFIWFRMAVPKVHQEKVGKTMIAFSLGTTDRRIASIKAAKARAALETEWMSDGPLPTGPRDDQYAPSEPEMLDAAESMAYRLVKSRLEDALANRDFKRHESFLQSAQRKLDELNRERISRKYEISDRIARGLAKKRNWHLDPVQKSAFQAMCSEALCDAFKVIIREHQDGELNPQPTTQTVLRAQQIGPVNAPDGERIMDLYEAYANRRRKEKKQSEDTIRQNRKVVEAFADFVGRRRSVVSISRREAREFRDTLAALPPNHSKQNRFAGMDLRAIAAEAGRLGLETTKPANLNRQLAAVSGLFRWLETEEHIDNNPFAKLNYNVIKEDNRRPPFDTDQLNQILRSPLFTGFRREGKEHLPGNNRVADWRFWIPLICLFTGARIGEVAQLRHDDVREEHGIWVIHFRHDPDRGQRTKSRKSRAIPVHEKLASIGFVDFCSTQGKLAETAAGDWLFPEIEPDARDSRGAKPSRFWRHYLERIGIKQGRDGLGSHSFRHGVTDELRIAEYTDDQLGPLVLGHSNKSVTSGYGRLPQGTVSMLNDMIQSMRFEGVGFDHLAGVSSS